MKMVSDSDIIARCIKGEQSAWSLFINQYNRHIDQQIIRIFHFHSYPPTEEDFLKVKDDVIDIIRMPAKLESITNRNDIRAWLSTVSRNKTHDYVRRKKSIRVAFDEETNKKMVSLQDPLGSAGNHTLEDVISHNEDVEDRPVHEMAGKVLRMLEGMDEKYRVPMKFYLIFHDYLLSSDEINNIARIRGVSPEVVKKQINQLIDRLLKKHEKSIRKEGKIIILTSYINRLKSRLHYLNQYPQDHQQKILEIEENLRKKETQLGKLIAKKSSPVVPSSKEIGAILGVRSGVVSIRLFRARKELKKFQFK